MISNSLVKKLFIKNCFYELLSFSTSIHHRISPSSHQGFVYSFLQVQTFLSWWQYHCIRHPGIWIFLFLLLHWQGRIKNTPTTNISQHALCLMLGMFVTLISFITLFTTCIHVILSLEHTSALLGIQPLTDSQHYDHRCNTQWRRIRWPILRLQTPDRV